MGYLSVVCVMSSAGNVPVRRAADVRVIAFDLPEGPAETTLRLFVEQSGEEIVYWLERVRGIQTRPVRGLMTATTALERMLAGTRLALIRDGRSDALSISLLPAQPPRTRDASAGPEVVKLNPFEVESDAYRGYIATRTISGGKTVLALSDVPQTVQVVTSDLIEDTGAIDPNDALGKIIPGVSSFIGPSGVNAIIRGFRAQNWSVDGATTRYLGMITNFNFDAFEVIKGPASVTFGPFAAYGGYINMVPKKPRRNHQNRMEVAAGTDRFYSAMLDVGGETGDNGDLQYRLVTGLVDTDRPGMNWDFSRVHMIAPSVAYDFNARTRATLRFEFSRSEQKLSSTALDASGRLVPSFASNGPSLPGANRFNTDENQIAQFVVTSNPGEGWSTRLNLLAGHGRKDFNQLNLLGQGPAKDYLLNPFQAAYDWWNFFADYAVSWRLEDLGEAGLSNHLVASASLEHWDISYVIFDGVLISPVNGWRVDPRAPDWPNLIYRFEHPTRYIRYNVEWLGGLVVEDRIGFLGDRLQLSGAVRWNYDNRSSHTVWRTPQNQSPGGTYTGQPLPATINERFTYRFGIVYKPVPAVALYAGYTEAYLAVGAIFKADGSRLVPETGENKELGVKFDIVSGGSASLSGNLAIFQVEVENKWRNDPVNTGYFIQDSRQINRGVEAQLIYTSERLSGLAGIYCSNGPFEPRTGLRAVVSPDLTANIWLKFSINSRLSVGGGYRYVGDTIANNRLLHTEPFGTADVFVAYTRPWSRGSATFRLGATNVTDNPAIYRMDSAAVVLREDARRIKTTISYVW